MHLLLPTVLSFALTTLTSIDISSVPHQRPATTKAPPRSSRPPAPTPNDAKDSRDHPSAQAARTIAYDSHTVVQVRTLMRFTTVIVLPESEDIQDFVCGDRDYWVISGTANVAYVKPARGGARTNLNLVTASGAIYSFLLEEVSGISGREPDLKVYVEPTQDSVNASSRTRATPSLPIRTLTAERDEARTALDRTRAESAAAIAAARALAPLELRFPYRYEHDKAPFFVTAIYHDATATYLQLRATELPALYEVRDGQPTLVAFTVQHGVYVVPRILDGGYLAIGKRRLAFTRRAE